MQTVYRCICPAQCIAGCEKMTGSKVTHGSATAARMDQTGGGRASNENKKTLLRVEGLKKVFRSGESDLVLFENLSFAVKRGEMLAIVGESGAGKSTLLHILSALDRASAGDVYCAHLRLNSLTAGRSRANFAIAKPVSSGSFTICCRSLRRPRTWPCRCCCAGQTWQQAEPEAARWLREVGLEQRAHHRSGELSGGEQQRVALARALITGPRLLLADEPTGDLDGQTAEAVFALIARLHREHQLTSLIATHNLSFARRCHRVLRLERGRVEEISPESLPA